MRVFLRYWIKQENKNFLGKGKVELLEHIDSSGSISKAAKNMKMSYKAAWDSIDSMNQMLPKHLVESISGGKGGGGTILTEEGKKAIVIFKSLENIADKIQTYLGDSQDFESLNEKIKALESKISDLQD